MIWIIITITVLIFLYIKMGTHPAGGSKPVWSWGGHSFLQEVRQELIHGAQQQPTHQQPDELIQRVLKPLDRIES